MPGHDAVQRENLAATMACSDSGGFPPHLQTDIFRIMLDSLVQQVAAIDIQGNIVAVNASWVSFAAGNSGRCREAYAAHNYLTVCENAAGEFAKEAQPASEGIRAVLAGNTPSFCLEYPCHAPWEKRWFLMHVTPLYDGGAVVGAVVSHLPITARKLAEERLRDSEANLHEAQRLAHLGSFSMDIEACVGDWSDELFRIFGLEPGSQEASAKTIIRMIHPDDRARIATHFDLGSLQGLGFSAEFRIAPQHRQERHVAMVCSYDLDDTGRPVHYHGAVMDITARHEAEVSLRRLATTDPLTGIANRRFFLDTLHGEMARVRRYARPLSVVMVDLDDFKKVNDTHGHAVGDQALKHVCDILRQTLRSVDTIGRLGGEEFGLILPETDADNAKLAVQRLLTALAASPLLTAGLTLRLTMSCGITTATGDAEIDELLRQADKALYVAKVSGKNRAEVYVPEESVQH